MLFFDVLNVIGENKEIQVYSKRHQPVTKAKREWLNQKGLASVPVYKIKDRPTDPYIFIELSDAWA